MVMLNSYQVTYIHPLRAMFGDRLQKSVSLARYTAARIGGPADWLLVANTSVDLANIVSQVWQLELPFTVLGSGSNVLISDVGIRGLVVINRARQIQFRAQSDTPSVWTESGANLGALARQAANLGLAGLEWAVGIPGTVGGAVFGNAGAHGSDMATNLLVAEILHYEGKKTIQEHYSSEQLELDYRSSLLKKKPGKAVVLSATLKLEHSTSQEVQRKVDAFSERRRATQPPGASMGSIFKNPPGDFAGRLIEAAGLKGTRIGGAEISTQHANFFVNYGDASANDIYNLIELAQQKVLDTSGVRLDLEVELFGEW